MFKKKRFCSFHHQNLTNVWAKIAPLAGLRRLPPPGLLLCQFRSQKNVVFHRFVSPKTRVLLCFGGFRPSKRCLLVSKRHVFYMLFEPLLGFRENARKPLYFTFFFIGIQRSLLFFTLNFARVSRLKSHLWPACRLIIKFGPLHLQILMNVSVKITPLAGSPRHPQNFLSSPSNFDECFG